LQDLQLLKRGNRLSVLPVSARSWRFILSLE
jgi:predicted RNA-binding protein with PUA-like domain